MLVRVALDVPLNRLFDYLVFDAQVVVGQRVLVPFSGRKMVGIVLALPENSDVPAHKLKQVLAVMPDRLPLSRALLDVLLFCSDYYHYPIGQVVVAALPTRLRSNKALGSKKIALYQLTELGRQQDLSSLSKKNVLQKQVLDLLSQQACLLPQLKALSPHISTTLKSLIKKNWLECVELDYLPNSSQAQSIDLLNAHALNDAQQGVFEQITSQQGFNTFLLHGITGSGKTEVYVHLMHFYLKQHKQVLLLVPEINLTPQLEHYFQQRFAGLAIASLHSGLAESARLNNWQMAQSGEARIVLGTRLSVFAELPELGLIIVDEEHDGSFKQQDGLRYSARDVAVYRARQNKIPVVLGSATPSFETYYHAQTGRYQLLSLNQRAQQQAKLPDIRLVNSNQTTMHFGVSENLLREIEIRLQRKEQSLVFINRRGYAPVMLCASCGWLSNCQHCAGKMVLHLKDQHLRCHHCGAQKRVPVSCPDCGSVDLQPVGSGTQRVEEVLTQRFPDARILRVDADSTRLKSSWKNMRDLIQANEVDILVGTQMLAKGHDFPELTLVGVLNADNALYSSDFRAPERLFAQLAQVAGRAGRASKAGQVIIQTAYPDHPLYRFLQKHDFVAWAKQQLNERKLAGFPPYFYQVLLSAEAEQEPMVFTFLNQARSQARILVETHQIDGIEILGVVPAALPRRANFIRGQLLIQANQRRTLQQLLNLWCDGLAELANVKLRYNVDVDPIGG